MDETRPGYRDGQAATMSRAHMPACPFANETPIPARVTAGLLLLLQSATYARDVAEDPWEFSVEWCELRRLGLTANDGRWLIRKGLVQHARETTSSDDAKRNFIGCKSPTLSARICLVLTENGLQTARQIAVAQGHGKQWDKRSPFGDGWSAGMLDGPPSSIAFQPIWDRRRRELRVGARIVKEFKVPAPNQEMVLDVFEEEHWPPRIDDPLPPKPGITSQRRLHDTINSLNRNQRHQLIRFFADGLGKGVRWEGIDESRVLA